MSNRLALRLLSGSKEGETVPIGDAGITVGRKPGNNLVLDDASVSGQHAKLTVEGGDLWVQDLASTNGTRVGGRKVERMSLLAGDEIAFGSVRLEVVEYVGIAAPAAPAASFLEDVDEISLEAPAGAPSSSGMPAQRQAPAGKVPSASLSAAVPSAAAPRARPAPSVSKQVSTAPELELSDDGPLRADLDAFERQQGGSKALTFGIVAVVLIGVGAGGWLAFGRGGDGGSTGAALAIAPIEGNLLGEDWSFEAAGAIGWSSIDEAPSSFARSRGGALSGRSGLVAEFSALTDGSGSDTSSKSDWAAERSSPVRVRVAQGVEASAAVEVEGNAFARVGIEFIAADGATTLGEVLWGEAQRGESSGADVRATSAALVPTGATHARVLVAGGGIGRVVVDDAALVALTTPRGPGARGEFLATTTGTSGGALVLTRLDVPLLRASAARGNGPEASESAWTIESVEGQPRLQLRYAGQGSEAGSGGHHLAITLAASDAGARPLAVVAGGNYRTSAGDFDAEGVTQILAGRGLELVRFEFERPVRIEQRVVASGTHIAVELGSLATVGVQLAFGSERDAAVTLAAANRRNEKEGRLGESLDGWLRLLATYGFESELVLEAERATARLTSLGAEQLDAIAQDVDRADFFELAGIYDECSERARAVLSTFTAKAGETNSVSTAAEALLARIATSRAALVESTVERGAQVDVAIRSYLERNGLEPLAERLSAPVNGGDKPRR